MSAYVYRAYGREKTLAWLDLAYMETTENLTDKTDDGNDSMTGYLWVIWRRCWDWDCMRCNNELLRPMFWINEAVIYSFEKHLAAISQRYVPLTLYHECYLTLGRLQMLKSL